MQPSVKGHIPQAWRLLKAWAQNELPARAPPFTKEQVEVLCGCTLTTPWMPLALLTGFWGLLRTGELLKIQACHVIPSGAHVLIHLGETKMTSRNAGVENVYIHHIYTAQLLQAWASVAKPHDYLVPVSQYQFRLSFSQAIQKCQFTGFKPYSLRRGGATALYIDTKSYTQVCQQGRWASERTARIYISDGVALLTEHSWVMSRKHRCFQTMWFNKLKALELPIYRRAGERGKAFSKLPMMVSSNATHFFAPRT